MIDGYPLDEAQASEFINDIGPPSAVICLELSDEVATGRLSSRGNFDDDATAIQKRLTVWNEKTKVVAQQNKAFVIYLSYLSYIFIIFIAYIINI